MFSDIVAEFENITKFGLLDYFERYRDFMQDGFANLSAYYSGNTSAADAAAISNFNKLLSDGKNLLQQFINFSNRLSNCGFWELQQYCQDLYDTLGKIQKLPKYYRTGKTVRGYQPYIQANADLGGMRTVQDIAESINSDGITETSLMLTNDLQEKDWEIDKLSTVTAYISNRSDISVTTILGEPIGKNVYGIDIDRKITIDNNDLKLKKYEENIDQKCDILLELEAGDIPENTAFGRTRLTGQTMSNYNYAELFQELQNVFLQDDLFSGITIENIDFQDGDIYATCSIETKYSYGTKKTLII